MEQTIKLNIALETLKCYNYFFSKTKEYYFNYYSLLY